MDQCSVAQQAAAAARRRRRGRGPYREAKISAGADVVVSLWPPKVSSDGDVARPDRRWLSGPFFFPAVPPLYQPAGWAHMNRDRESRTSRPFGWYARLGTGRVDRERHVPIPSRYVDLAEYKRLGGAKGSGRATPTVRVAHAGTPPSAVFRGRRHPAPFFFSPPRGEDGGGVLYKPQAPRARHAAHPCPAFLFSCLCLLPRLRVITSSPIEFSRVRDRSSRRPQSVEAIAAPL
jgi:hypothetical protein